MKSSKAVWLSLAMLVLVVSIFVVGDQIAQRNIRRADFGPLTNLLMGRLGEVLTVPIAQSDQADAPLFTTYQRAVEVAGAVDLRARKMLPKAATELSTGSDRLDGWGNPFCLVSIGGRVAAVSGGPRRPGKLNCTDLGLDLARVANKPSGRLYRYAGGELVFVSAGPPLGLAGKLASGDGH